jgi:hypothetical protein
MQQKKYLQDLGLLIMENNLPLQLLKVSSWSIGFYMSPRVVFSLERKFLKKYGGENKKYICFAKISRLYFYDNKLWLVDV